MHEIKDYLSYDPETGVFIRIQSYGRPNLCGKPLGTLSAYGYIVVWYKGKVYRAHRLAWYFVYGEFPENFIDHINENKIDNRIVNLREATDAQNKTNISTPPATNKSGFLGVSWCKCAKKWRAQLRVDGVYNYLGIFDDPVEAHETYLTAKRTLHPFWQEHKNV